MIESWGLDLLETHLRSLRKVVSKQAMVSTPDVNVGTISWAGSSGLRVGGVPWSAIPSPLMGGVTRHQQRA